MESDGNNLALRRVIRFLKKAITRAGAAIAEGALVAEEVLDAIGSAVVQLCGLVGYPLKYVFSVPEIFSMFAGKPLPMTLPLIFVVHIIMLIYSTFVLCYMPAVGLGLTSPESISFHIITGLALVSYYRGVTTNPGNIPETPEWEKDNATKKQEGLRFCSREKKYKPERTHYCSAIGRNVLKMDHYCPWLANCVGYLNHKFFMLFIMYASVSSGWATISVAHLLATSSGGFLAPKSALSAAQIFFLTEGLCISSLISMILTPFTGFHLWLVSRNKTTLEYCEKSNPRVSYDFGIVYNICQVFGYNPIFWLLPVQTAPGDGLEFDRKDVLIDSEEDFDEEEAKIRNQIAKEHGIVENSNCCISKWDDSPLLLFGGPPADQDKGNYWKSFLSMCFDIDQFRQRCQMGFTKIVSTPTNSENGLIEQEGVDFDEPH